MKVCNVKLLYFSFPKTWSKNPFFYLEFLKVYEAKDLTAASDSEV